ncbi:MAG: TetR/AcrR family transcriptional regulator, partial [Lachnospiraceae bacterium]|nr:TetR/AcrR family transcriptional regulator [Lachnospiraceae bacterium]
NGCLAINKLMSRNHCSDWKKIQKTIDAFIKAGLESFLIHDQRK